MEKLSWAEALIPIVTFWGVFNSQREIVKFLNDMRDTVIFRHKDDHKLSTNHRKCIYQDWVMTYTASTLAFGLFSWLVTWMAQQIADTTPIRLASTPTLVIAAYMWVSTIFLIICGVNDDRLIRENLNIKKMFGI